MQDLNKEYVASILEAIQAPAFIVDGNLTIKIANASGRELLKAFDHEIEGRSLAEILGGSPSAIELEGQLRDVMKSGSVLEDVPLELDVPLTGSRTLRVTARQVHPPSDFLIVTMTASQTDISEPDRPHSIEGERFRVALKNSHIAIFNQDRDLRYTWIYNDPLGYTSASILGKTDADLFSPESAAELTRIKRQTLETGKGTRQEVMLVFRGEKVYRDLTVEPLLDGKGDIIGITGAAADITDRNFAEAALRESEEWFSKAFQLSPAPMTIVSVKDQRFIDVNLSVERLSGFVREEIIGHTSAELNAVRESAGRSQLWENLEQLRSVRDQEVKLFTKSGEERYVLASSEVVTIGGEAYVLGLMQDITERKKNEAALRQSEERFSKVFQASPVGMVIKSVPDQTILDVNESAERLTGYSREELVGHTLAELSLIVSLEAYNQVLQSLSMEKSSGNQELVLQTKQKELRNVLLHAHIFALDGHPRILDSFLDVTDRKQAEKQALELAVEREKQLILEQLLLTASHDLRTPISAISVTAYLLNKLTDKLLEQRAALVADLAGGPSGIPQAQKTLLDEIATTIATIKTYSGRMDKSADRLKHLVEKMFDMVRLDSRPEFEFQAGDLSQVVDRVVDLYIPKAARKNLELHFTAGADLPAVILDADEFDRVVRNLIENAIYYTDAGGQIRVRTYREGDCAVLEVKDTGIGIAEPDLDHIFERFYRADKARSTETGGSGLGLAIVRKIVEAHHGKVEVASVLGSGSTFRVLLPLSPPLAPENLS